MEASGMEKNKNNRGRYLWLKAVSWINAHTEQRNRNKPSNSDKKQQRRLSVRVGNKENLFLDPASWSPTNLGSTAFFDTADDQKRRSTVLKPKRRFSVFLDNMTSLNPASDEQSKPANNVAWVMLDAKKASKRENLQNNGKEVEEPSDIADTNVGESAVEAVETIKEHNTHANEKINSEVHVRTRTETFSWLRKFSMSVGKRSETLRGESGHATNKSEENSASSSEFYADEAMHSCRDRRRPTLSEIMKCVEASDHNGQIILLPDDDFWAETANNARDIHRGNVFFSLLNIDQSAKIYENEFLHKPHLNYAVEDKMGRKMIISILVGDELDHPYRTIIRTCDKVLPGKIETWQCPQPMSLEQIARYTLPEINLSHYKLLQGEKVVTKILNYDKQIISNCFKFGILYQKSGQITEEEMYENVNHSDQMQEFLDFIATPVVLKEHKGFNGGLDTKYGLTGSMSYYTIFEENEIMFHVSTLLPHCPNDRQQIERKRHIGNDIVTVIFQDPGAQFCPSVISSQFLQVFLCVQPVDGDSYRVAVAAKSDISRFGPFIEGVGYYKKDSIFRKCFFSKLINAQIAACNSSGKIGSMLRRRRHMLFDQLYDELTKGDTVPKSAKPLTHRSKSVDLTSQAVHYPFECTSNAHPRSTMTFWSKKLSKLHSV